ncbi:MAG TPA: S8 family peptidase [Flavipsychrobacter sp.]|nr:S8 family peptidase [Flavipsychrobacter sp.]
MRVRFLCSLLCFFLFTSGAQALSKQYAFRISFTNKAGSANINNPISFLSQRALDRRTKFGIAIDTTDLPVSPAYLDSVKQLTSGLIHTTSRWMNNCVLIVDDSSKILLLQNKPYINNIVLVGWFSNGLHDKPSPFPDEKFRDKLFAAPGTRSKTTGTAAYYGAAWDQTQVVRGDCLHDLGFKGQGMLITVLDNGFNWVNSAPGFDSLYTSGRIIDTYNISRDTPLVYGYGSHGTEVLSILAGYIPNTFVGAAPLAQYALFITEDAGFEQPIEIDNLIAGIERADSIGTDVASISLGYNVFDAPFPAITASQLDGNTTIGTRAVNMAVRKGIAVIGSAGNEGTGGLLAPSDANDILTVGSVDVSKVAAPTSGYGPNASGVIKPNICGMGHPAAALTTSTTPNYISGTSMATPSIAGFTACLMQANPTKDPFQVRSVLQQTAHRFTNPTANLGYGVPDFCNANTLLDVKGVVKTDPVACYPNPFTHSVHITLHLPLSDRVSIKLMDITGKVIYREDYNVKKEEDLISLSTSSLSAGVYFIRVSSSVQSQTIKLVKQ